MLSATTNMLADEGYMDDEAINTYLTTATTTSYLATSPREQKMMPQSYVKELMGTMQDTEGASMKISNFKYPSHAH